MVKKHSYASLKGTVVCILNQWQTTPRGSMTEWTHDLGLNFGTTCKKMCASVNFWSGGQFQLNGNDPFTTLDLRRIILHWCELRASASLPLYNASSVTTCEAEQAVVLMLLVNERKKDFAPVKNQTMIFGWFYQKLVIIINKLPHLLIFFSNVVKIRYNKRDLKINNYFKINCSRAYVILYRKNE
jgi:hypothetical protein